MTRRSKEERRVDYLDIGAELVAVAAGRAEPGLALAHVKLADVAARAGVTKGALYHLWPSQEAFWHDLLDHLMATDQIFGAEQMRVVESTLIETGRTGADLTQYANAVFDSIRSDPSFLARVSLFSYLGNEFVRAELDRSYRTSIDHVMPALEGLLESSGRRLVAGVTAWDLAVLISALLEGLCLQSQVSPERTPELPLPDGDRWTLFAAAAEALLEGCTELIDPPASGEAS
jgi:AcrR family transcriptional regulator